MHADLNLQTIWIAARRERLYAVQRARTRRRLRSSRPPRRDRRRASLRRRVRSLMRSRRRARLERAA